MIVLDPEFASLLAPAARSLEGLMALDGDALRDVDGTQHRFPCFHVGVRHAVLPAFGTFTGGHTIHPVRGDRVFVVCDGAVFAAAAR